MVTVCERERYLEVLTGDLQGFMWRLEEVFFLILNVPYSLYLGPAGALTCPPAVSFGQ